MTELDLLDGIAEEVRAALKDFRLRSAKEKLIPINVYTQNLPVKEAKEDERIYPYVCVCMEEEEIKEKGDPLRINTYCEIGVIDRNRDMQGYRDVLQIANLIYQHIFRKGIIARAFSPEYPFRILLNQDDKKIFPYFIGGIEMGWELSVFEMEDKLI